MISEPSNLQRVHKRRCIGGSGIAGTFASRGFAVGGGFDPRSLSSAPHLLEWWTGSRGLVPATTLLAEGSAPTVTWSGAGSVIGLLVQCNDISGGAARGQAKVRVSMQGGVPGSWMDGITTGANVPIMGADITLHFATGTYSTSYSWEPAPSAWIGQQNGHVLSQPVLVTNPRIRANLIGGRTGLAFLGGDDLLLCIDGLAAQIVGGEDRPFMAFSVVSTPMLTAANVHWSLQNTVGAAFCDYFTNLTSPASNKKANSGSVKSLSAGTIDTAAHLHRFTQFGTTASCHVDKELKFSGAQDADSMDVNCLSVGGTYVGSSPSNQNPLNITALLFYDTASLTANQINEIETGLMTYYRI